VFQLAGLATTDGFAARRAEFDAIAASFGPLRPGERAEVRESRLRLFRARAGEKLDALVAQKKSRWSAAEAAVGNGLPANGPLPEARLLKLPVAEPYRGESAPAD
jgi:hypothetical protein